MLLVANLANTKWCKKPEKWPKPWQMGTHMKVLGESFPMNTNMTGFRWFFENICVLVLWMKEASSLEGLYRVSEQEISAPHGRDTVELAVVPYNRTAVAERKVLSNHCLLLPRVEHAPLNVRMMMMMMVMMMIMVMMMMVMMMMMMMMMMVMMTLITIIMLIMMMNK